MANSLKFRLATKAELEAWDQLVSTFPGVRVFHKRAWILSIAGSHAVRPLQLVAEVRGEIAACFPGFIQRIGPLKLFGSPREGWQTESMGPVYDPCRTGEEEVIDAAVRYLEDDLGVDHVEIVSNVLRPDFMRSRRFIGESIFTYRIDLYPNDVERSFLLLDKKTRNQVRKAQKLGIKASVAPAGEEFIEEFWDQIREVFQRRGAKLPFTKKRVVELTKHLRAAGSLLPIWVHEPAQGRCIATGIYLVDGTELSLWGWTHRTAFRWHCPTEILQWTAMLEGIAAGCNTCDMAGGGHAKVKFGAVADATTYRWMRSRYEWMMRLRNVARRVYRLRQSSLPVRPAPRGGFRREWDGHAAVG